MFFFFNDTATTEIYTLSLHDALPIYRQPAIELSPLTSNVYVFSVALGAPFKLKITRDGKRRLHRLARGDVSVFPHGFRSEEHTSELQSRQYLVCRLLLEKKNTKNKTC